MCLAILAKIVEVEDSVAKVDFGEGVLREVNVSLVEAKAGLCACSLDPIEFFFHVMGGREGLVDTVRTRQSGYGVK